MSNFPDVSGRGGLVASGRWHTRPKAIVYCADEAHTAYCEILRQVGADFLIPDDYKLLKIEIPSYIKFEEIAEASLDPDWKEDGSRGWNICRPFGNEWLNDRNVPVLKVPSAARLGSYNYLMNPVHREADDIRITEIIGQPFPDFCTRAPGDFD